SVLILHQPSDRVHPGGNKFDAAGIRRQACNLYFEDGWKATPQLTVSYSLRYEVDRAGFKVLP
ncbi:MAG TPA: hypothetical protein VF783_26950, partial [Terriglobales bacterium]